MTGNNKQIKRVLDKLNTQYLQGSDFDDRRWVFDWDDDLSLDDNLSNIIDEDNALQTLTSSGVIKSRLIPNRYRSDQLDKFIDPRFSHLPEHERVLYGDWYDTDPAHREWDWIRTLDGFNYEKFSRQSQVFGYTPSVTSGTTVSFRLIDGVIPEASYGTRVLEFKPLAEDTLTQRILEYASWHHGETVSLKKLREELPHKQLRESGANINQFFKNSPFVNGSLSVFATIKSQSIVLRNTATLTASQLEDLETSSIQN